MAGNVFSLHIDEYLTKVAHLSYNKGKIELLSLGFDATVANFFTNPTEKSATLQSQVITRLTKELNIKESLVQVVLPDSLTYSQLMVMPKLKDEEIAKSLRLQVDELIPLPISEVNMDFEVLETLPDERILLVFVAIQKKISDLIAHSLDLAKLEPVSLENDLNVIGRYLSEIDPLVKEPAIILNIGFSGSSIYIANAKSQYFQYFKNLKTGYLTFLQEVKLNFNVDDRKAIEMLQKIGLDPKGSVNVAQVLNGTITQIASEIENTILLMKERHQIVIKHVYLFNYDIYISHIHEVLQNLLSLPTMPIPIGNIFVPNPITQSFRHSLSSFLPVIAGHFR